MTAKQTAYAVAFIATAISAIIRWKYAKNIGKPMLWTAIAFQTVALVALVMCLWVFK